MVSSAGQTSVALTWRPSTDNVGVVGYGVYSNGTLAASSTSTGYTLTGLTCGTSHSLAVDAYDAAGNRSSRATVTTSTAACPVTQSATQPPTAPTGIALGTRTTTSISITWTASTDNLGVAGYDLYAGSSDVGTATATAYTFTNLTCGTSYTLGVDAYDAAGNHSPETTGVFSTSACPDTTPPSTPTGLVVSSAGQTSVALAWNASTDNVGVVGYGVYSNGKLVASPTSTGYVLTGLSCGTSYTVAVDAYDAAGNRSSQATVTTSTVACPDNQPPTAPAVIALATRTTTNISITWTASIDNVGVVGYDLFADRFAGGTNVGTATATAYTFTNLTCSTSYRLGVDAYDAAGNHSTETTVVLSTSACPPDTTPPSTPTGLATSGVGQTGATLSWTASSDNVGVTGYRLYRGSTQVGTSASTSYSFSGLTCSTSYTLGVAAYDAAGNVSGTASLNAATSGCSTSGAVVYLSPSGSDSSCVRGDSSHPCATLAGAWAIAQAGDTINVADGMYSGNGCSITTGKASNVTFVGSTNAKFPCQVNLGNVGNSVNLHIVINGLSMEQLHTADNYITVENGLITCSDSAPYILYTPDNKCSSRVSFDAPSSNVLVQDETIGPSYESGACGGNAPNGSAFWGVTGPVTLRRVTFIDSRRGCGGNTQHEENLRVDNFNSNVTLDGVAFRNGPGSGEFVSGSTFDGSGPDSAELFITGTQTNFIMENSYCYGAGNVCVDGASDSNFSGASYFRNNVFYKGTLFQHAYPTTTYFTDNVFQGCPIGQNGSSGGTIRGNVGIGNSGCNGSDTSTSQTWAQVFTNPVTGDFSLKAGSAAIDAGSDTTGDYAANDGGGVARWCGAASDAGAYERCP